MLYIYSRKYTNMPPEHHMYAQVIPSQYDSPRATARMSQSG